MKRMSLRAWRAHHGATAAAASRVAAAQTLLVALAAASAGCGNDRDTADSTDKADTAVSAVDTTGTAAADAAGADPDAVAPTPTAAARILDFTGDSGQLANAARIPADFDKPDPHASATRPAAWSSPISTKTAGPTSSSAVATSIAST